jgi:hypothetical protein
MTTVNCGATLPRAITPRLEFRSKSPPELLELQIEPLAHLSPTAFSSPEPSLCPSCGFDARKLERAVIEGASVPSHVDLFRPQDLPAMILATERLAEAVQHLGLTGISMSEVDTHE